LLLHHARGKTPTQQQIVKIDLRIDDIEAVFLFDHVGDVLVKRLSFEHQLREDILHLILLIVRKLLCSGRDWCSGGFTPCNVGITKDRIN